MLFNKEVKKKIKKKSKLTLLYHSLQLSRKVKNKEKILTINNIIL